MNVIEKLLNRRWVVKKEEPELYFEIKDKINNYSDFLRKLNYSITKNNMLIKLNKLPGIPSEHMGIEEFDKKEHYALLCTVLMYLEEKAVDEPFILSELVEYIGSFYEGDKLDFTKKSVRRMITKVIRLCIQNNMIKKYDGDEKDYEEDAKSEVLYRNTGISKYFMLHFHNDISNFETIDDYNEPSLRQQRVYRRLLLDMGIYSETGNDEDFAYIKNYRNFIKNDFENVFDCDLQIHKTSAYLVMGENSSLGSPFPDKTSISGIVMIINFKIRSLVQEGFLKLENNENIIISVYDFENIIYDCKKKYQKGFAANFRGMGRNEFCTAVMNYMKYYNMIAVDECTKSVVLRPIVGKITGMYPEDYKLEEDEKNGKQMENE